MNGFIHILTITKADQKSGVDILLVGVSTPCRHFGTGRLSYAVAVGNFFQMFACPLMNPEALRVGTRNSFQKLA